MARISRLLIVLAVMTYSAAGFADDWRPTTVVTPNGPAVGSPYVSTVGNPYVPALPSGYYGPAPKVKPGETPPAAGPQPPVVTGVPYEPDCCFDPECSPPFDQNCPSYFDDDCRHTPRWGRRDRGLCWDCCACKLGRWYAQADALWLKRNKPNNKSLTIYTPSHHSSSDPITLNTDDLSFDTEAGTHLTIGRFISCTTSIEGTFFGFQDFDAAGSTGKFPANSLNAYWIGSNNGLAPHRTDSFEDAVMQSANYTSEVWDWELGVRRKVSRNGSLLVGFRYMDVDEKFTFWSLDESPPAPRDLGVYDIETDNDLVGLQVGGEQAFYTPGRHLRLTVFGKAGMFVNFHEQRNRLYSPNVTAGNGAFSSSRSNDSSRLSSVLEFGAVLSLQLSENIALRGGYTHIFINGLALAPDQLDTAPDRSNSRMFVNDNGDLHLSGPFVGGEFLLP